MSRLEIILLAISTLSILLNILIISYSRKTITELLSISEELGDIQEMVNSFANHIKAVYNMEMFYGDETLGGLMEHAISFNEQLETFEYIYSLTTIKEDEGNDINEPDNTTKAEEDSTQAEEEN